LQLPGLRAAPVAVTAIGAVLFDVAVHRADHRVRHVVGIHVAAQEVGRVPAPACGCCAV